MFDVGGGELLLIILALILLFGPEKLPEIARLFNKGIQKARQAQLQLQKELQSVTQEVQRNIEPVKKSLDNHKFTSKPNDSQNSTPEN
ncbi:MAG: twin-arginine translocase TatA/TatE family subunit [Candidatus Kapaibacteriales bacterium]